MMKVVEKMAKSSKVDFSKTDLVKRINDNYKSRKITKEKFDSMINLAVSDDTAKLSNKSIRLKKNNKVRLLDEGAVIGGGDGHEYVRFVIKKGAIRDWYNQLSSDYVGSINIGHTSYATNPNGLVGTWTKKDLSLVDNGDGKFSLDVTLNLDNDDITLKEMKRKKIPLGVSAEFLYTIDWESTLMTGHEILSTINITDFAIVGEAGNVGSGGITLNNIDGGNEDMGQLAEKFLAILNKPETAKPESQKPAESKPDDVERTLSTEEEEQLYKLFEDTVEENSKLTLALDEATTIIEGLKTQADEYKEKLAEATKTATNATEQLTNVSKKEQACNSVLDRFKHVLSVQEEEEKPEGYTDQANQQSTNEKPVGEIITDGFGRL